MTRSIPQGPAWLIAILMALSTVLVPAASSMAQDATPAAATPSASPVAGEESGAVDLDVLFIGAHPDDEAGALSTFGQWNEYSGMEVGVITITRGEGGGNAVGTEEGPALGLLREQEEREAVGIAGIEHIYNLDKVDFYYNLSAPLTEGVWGHDDTLERVVRVVRTTQPEVIVTMNPAPATHGHHQMAARLAVEAYQVAGDPSVFPQQIDDEGLQAWSPGKVFLRGFEGEDPTGESCVTDFTPAEPTDVVYGVWAGTVSEANGGATWAQLEQEARRVYASQGWAGFGDAPENPDEIGCDYFTLVDSRVPYTIGNSEPTAMLEGALLPTTGTTGGLPAGTVFEVETARFDVVTEQQFEIEVTAEVPSSADMSVSYELPEGWSSEVLTSSVENGTLEEVVAITPSADAEPGSRYRIVATLEVDGATGQNVEIVEVQPPVEGHVEPLPLVAEFREWLGEVDAPVLDSLIKPVVPIGVGETREIDVIVTNNTDELQDGTVTLVLAPGFVADSETLVATNVPSGERATLTFSITNEDTTLPTGIQGGIEGDYLLDIRTVSSGVVTTEIAALNLVPAVTVPPAGESMTSGTPTAATPVASPVAGGPMLDGTISEGEYTSEALDISHLWEGDEPDSPQDASGQAWLAWDENGLYVAVEVTDEAKGTVLPQADAKRHWRTDSVEIAIDPLGTATDTSATFKVGIFAETQEGGPAAYRDADAFQGPVAETAPGFEVASTVSEPYTGYVIETFIPYDALPAPVDPDDMTMNIFIYDSDTDDLTGQTRLGWSTWGGVQGTPYRWGHVDLAGYTATDGGELDAPQMPLEVAQSVNSPWSIMQSAEDGVPLGGAPAVADGDAIRIVTGPNVVDGTLRATIEAAGASGEVNAFALSGDEVLGQQAVTVGVEDVVDIAIEVGDANPANMTLALSFESDDGAVQALAAAVEP